MALHTHLPEVSRDLGTRLMAMGAPRRIVWAAVAVVLLWLAVWWALSFEARAAVAPAMAAVEVVR